MSYNHGSATWLGHSVRTLKTNWKCDPFDQTLSIYTRIGGSRKISEIAYFDLVLTDLWLTHGPTCSKAIRWCILHSRRYYCSRKIKYSLCVNFSQHFRGESDTLGGGDMIIMQINHMDWCNDRIWNWSAPCIKCKRSPFLRANETNAKPFLITLY